MATPKVKVKVLKKFRDKYTKNYHEKDTILSITKERLDEIVKVDASLIEEVKATKKAEKTAE